MLKWCKMKNISGYTFKTLVLWFFLLTAPAILKGQDTLRTYGPRISVDLARVGYLFADPSELGAEGSIDLEIYPNLYPVFEVGYNSVSEERSSFNYSSAGVYGRIGADYNLLPLKDRSVHHTISAGLRYGVSVFTHTAEDVLIPGEYWGDFRLDSYRRSLTGHWIELVAGFRAEVLSNFFMGWSLRYRILVNPEMDPLVTPQLIPGFGAGSVNRGVGFSYTIGYKFPVLKR